MYGRSFSFDFRASTPPLLKRILHVLIVAREELLKITAASFGDVPLSFI